MRIPRAGVGFSAVNSLSKILAPKNKTQGRAQSEKMARWDRLASVKQILSVTQLRGLCAV